MENDSLKSLKEALTDKGLKPYFPVGFYWSIGKSSVKGDFKILTLPYYKARLDVELEFYKPISKF